MVKQYQPDGSFVYIKEEKDIKNCPKYLKHAINLTTPLYHGTLKFSGATNCKEGQECKITSRMFTEKPSFLKKYSLHSITFYTKENWVQVLVRFTYQFTLSKNFKLFRYKI
jgi:hypothetical protein